MSRNRFRIGFFTQASYQKYQADMLSGVVAAAAEFDADIVRLTLEIDFTVYMPDDEKRTRLANLCSAAKNFSLDGMLVLGWAVSARDVRELLGCGAEYPIVALGTKLDGVPSVYQDGGVHIEGLVSHLVEQHKRKKIAFIEPTIPDSRVDYYKTAMQRYGIFDPYFVVSRKDVGITVYLGFEERAKRITDFLLGGKRERPDAIMSMSAEEAVTITSNMIAGNVRVPEDIAVTSWEESDLCRYNEPQITTVYYPFYEIGYEGGRTLLRHLAGGRLEMETIAQSKIIFRRSCGCNSLPFSKGDGAKPGASQPLLSLGEGAKGKIAEELNPRLSVLVAEEAMAAFERSLACGDAGLFRRWLEGIIGLRGGSVELLHMIRDDIFAIRGALKPHTAIAPGEACTAEDIWMDSQIVIGQWIEKAFGAENLYEIQFALKVKEMGLDLIRAFDLGRIRELFAKNLLRLSVPACYLFEAEPGDCGFGACRMLFGFADGEVLPEPAKGSGAFPTETLFGAARHTYLVHMLRIRNTLIGYALYEYSIRDERIYTTLSVELSSAIHGAKVVNELTRTNADLLAARNEVLANMEIIRARTAEVEESNRKLSDLDNLKNDFIANITHDFRSPLMIILNNIDLSLKYDDALSADTRKKLKVVLESSYKLKSSIDRLLDLAKLDAHGLRISVKRVPIRRFITEVADFYKSVVYNTGIEVESVIGMREKEIYTDPDKLEEVLNNVISNSMKFVDPGNGKITIGLEEEDARVRIYVSDNGIGIPKNKLETIFGRFEQLESGRKSRYRGTGIGLAFSRELMSYLKGTIHAESEGPGKGARFVIEIPEGKSLFTPEEISDDEASYTGEDPRRVERKSTIESQLAASLDKEGVRVAFADPNGENEFDPKKGVILIIDDNREIREIVLEYLRNNGYANFILAADGFQGVEAAYAYRPDLIISDYNMPNLRGDQIHDELAGNPDFRKIPFVFLTAVADKNIVLERKKKGALAYLGKPVDEADLILTIELHLAKYMELKSTLYQATVDELTKLNNKRNLLKLARNQLGIRRLRDVSFLFMDLDHFKRINDNYGHQTGDSVLEAAGGTIRNTLRQYDIAGRYGGEEFLIVLPETSADNAAIVAEKLRNRIKEIKIPVGSTTVSCTASFGISSLLGNGKAVARELGIPDIGSLFDIDHGRNADWETVGKLKLRIPDVLISIADKAMYESKRTTCTDCGFQSSEPEGFADSECPECKSARFVIGRDRVTIAPDVEQARENTDT